MVQKTSRRIPIHGILSSLADKDIWMRDKGNHYEYIATYVNDLAIGSKAPKEITDEL
jgi:hypothetical protein